MLDLARRTPLTSTVPNIALFPLQQVRQLLRGPAVGSDPDQQRAAGPAPPGAGGRASAATLRGLPSVRPRLPRHGASLDVRRLHRGRQGQVHRHQVSGPAVNGRCRRWDGEGSEGVYVCIGREGVRCTNDQLSTFKHFVSLSDRNK